MNRKEIVEQLEALKPELARRYKVRELGLFGSWVRGAQNAKSDIDVLVEFDKGADLFDLIGLGLHLEDIFQCPVDVVPRTSLRQEIRSDVLEQVVRV